MLYFLNKIYHIFFTFIFNSNLYLFLIFFPDSFVNSQEWTISRSVPDLRLGIVGSLNSGKSALVHRYLTGSYMQEESPEGGRFKKEVFIDGQSYLLLIRDEGGAPEMQVSTTQILYIKIYILLYNFYYKLKFYQYKNTYFLQ